MGKIIQHYYADKNYCSVTLEFSKFSCHFIRQDIFKDIRTVKWRNRQKVERMELLGGYDSEDEDNFITKEITVETVLNTKEELVY